MGRLSKFWREVSMERTVIKDLDDSSLYVGFFVEQNGREGGLDSPASRARTRRK